LSGPAWVAFLLAGAIGVWLVGHHYWRREPAARTRWVLGGLRACALLLLILLLFDPSTRAPDGGLEDEVVLVDASLSMTGPATSGTRWDSAVALAGARDARVILFGQGAESVAAGALAEGRPDQARSSAVEAIRVAAESGARSVLVVTDGEIEDAAAAAAAAREAEVDLRWRVVGVGPVPNVALAEFETPRWGEPGDTAEASVAVAATTAAPGERLRVEIRHGDALLGVATLAAPEPGTLARARVPFAIPAAPGSEVRLDARVTPGGGHGEDDVRAAYLRVAEDGGGVVLLSFEPDWEVRFLLPALEAATGLPTAGYLASVDGSWLRAGPRSGRLSAAAVGSAARSAELLVLHGLGPGAPAWARALVEAGPPLLLLPGADGAPAELPVAAPATRGEEWYLAEQPPASPLAAGLGGLAPDSLPPLSDLRPLRPAAPEHRVALAARRGRRGPETPVLVLGERGRQRWAAALASGYWRWSLRGGRARAGYRQLWSSVTGWLLAGEPTRADEPIRPLRRVVARGDAQGWAVRGEGDSLSVVFTPADGGPALARAAPVANGAALLGPLPPGHYAYEARAEGSGGAPVRGALTVETYPREYARPAARLEDVEAGAGALSRAAATRPLHASPWAWVLVVALVCAEWVLRRREGLR
jgi:hypothetical protein